MCRHHSIASGQSPQDINLAGPAGPRTIARRDAAARPASLALQNIEAIDISSIRVSLSKDPTSNDLRFKFLIVFSTHTCYSLCASAVKDYILAADGRSASAGCVRARPARPARPEPGSSDFPVIYAFIAFEWIPRPPRRRAPRPRAD
ncbi:hypothetical protein EVAR_67656_1 [Eumeta japonica]|uniref:Uncharacterized protein n=1 Tax=Eumeta variegata TaxID=151549 RepID=A0A4C1ZBR5_EUMVA|nr:hypothetical protein EVAR_67656_1 [Eumeta japonica]